MPFISSKLLLDAFKNIREPASTKEVFEYLCCGHPELSNHITAALDAGERYGYISKIDDSHYILTDHAFHNINDLSLPDYYKTRYLYYNVKKDDQKQSTDIKTNLTVKNIEKTSTESRENRGEARGLIHKRAKRRKLSLDRKRSRRSCDDGRSTTRNISKSPHRDK